MSAHTTIYNKIKTLFEWNDTQHEQRIIVVILGFFIIFLAICSQLLHLVLNDEDDAAQYTQKITLTRREIVDRNNIVLASNIPSVSLYANPKKILNAQEAAEALQKLLPDLTKNQLLNNLTKKNSSFRWLKRDLTKKQQMAVHNLGIPGLYFESEQKRIYPLRNITSHILGYVGRDYTGLAGIEKYFDEEIMVPNDSDALNAPISLSIDSRVQNIVHEELSAVIDKFSAKAGTCVVADPNTGEIIAMVSLPDFDPYQPGSAKPEHLFNQASLGVYEVGSVMKPLTMAIAFDASSSHMTDLYDLSPMRVANFTVKDYHKNDGWHSVAEIFLHSSNIGVAQMALEVGEATFKNYLKRLNLLNSTTIELPEKGRPLYPSLKKQWPDLSMVTMSYGYGLSVTPLNFIQAMIPTVNGGIMQPITLVKQNETNKKIGKRVLQEETSANINKLLRVTVKQGTGRKSKVPGYYLGAKTGTANKRQNGKYVNNSRMSSFVATFPAHKPKYLFYMLLDDPQGIKETHGFATGGWTAAPAIGKIVKRMVALYGIPPYNSEDPEIIELENIAIKADDNV